MLNIFHKLLFQLLHVKKSTRLQGLFSEWVKIQIFLADSLKKKSIIIYFMEGAEGKGEREKATKQKAQTPFPLPLFYLQRINNKINIKSF